MAKSSSRNVNRYIWAVMTRRALAEALAQNHDEQVNANGALTGKQLSEAERIIQDRALLDREYKVEVKMRRVKPARPKCSECGGSGRDRNPLAGTETCLACNGTGRARKAVAS